MIRLDDVSVINTYNDILKTADGNVLALDISQNSTGIALYVDGKFSTHVVKTPKPKVTDVFYDLTLAKNFIREIYDVIPKSHYDIVVIEGIYAGDYAHVYKVLHSLAMGFDLYLQSGAITYTTYKKVDNRSWKSQLRKVSGRTGKVYIKDKEDVVESLKALSLTEDSLSIKGHGIQDQFDAVGLLLTAIVGKNTQDTSPKTRKGITFEFYTEAGYNALRRKMELLESPYGFTHTHTKAQLAQLALKEGVWYALPVSTTGALGVKSGFVETIGGINYIVFKRKG